MAFGRAWGLDTRYGDYLQAQCLRLLGDAFGPRLFVGAAAQPQREATPSLGGQDAAGPEGRDGPEVFSGEDEPVAPELAVGRDRLRGAPLVYIHAKVSIFDDAAIVSSANLNGRSLCWDTEAGVLLTEAESVERLRARVMTHWLPADPDPRYLDPTQAVAMWRLLAGRNARLPPERREGFILPYDRQAAERIGRSVPGIPEEMV